MDPLNEQQAPSCSHCGTVLADETTGGLCPRCLLEMNLASRTMPGGEAVPQMPPPTPEEMAGSFPQFEILECLGRGGMGIVYKARQKTLDRLVAIKVLAGERRDDPDFEERFSREARTLAKMSHPNIVTVHDFGESDGLFYLVMEFIDGVNLRDVLSDGRMASSQALAIVPSVCEALQFAHDHGVVHRDIKPENILMDRDGRVKIADFGIATLVGATGERSGTPPYMAPEQGTAVGGVDHRADIYALGVVFYEMLTGERPKGDPTKPSGKVEIDVRLDEIVLKALEREPELRYQTAGEFRTVVETMAVDTAKPDAGRQSLDGDERRFPSATAGRKYNPWEVAIVGLGTLFFVVMISFAWEWSNASFTGICILGLVICVLSLAGIWPFPSPFFPDPNFSSRNVSKRRTAHRNGSGSPAPAREQAWIWNRRKAWVFGIVSLGFVAIALGEQAVLHQADQNHWRAAMSLVAAIGFCIASIKHARAAREGASNAAAGSASKELKKSALWPRMLSYGLVSCVILGVVLAALLFWMQRPQRVDQGMSGDSSDGMFSAMGYTWHEMRVFGGDRSFYKFRIQGKAGSVSERWEVDVPYESLATSYLLLARDEVLFGKHGSIVWSEDGKRVSFRVNGSEVSAFNTEDGGHSFQGGFHPQREVVLTPGQKTGCAFLDLDTGSVGEPGLNEILSAAHRDDKPDLHSPQLVGTGKLEWMRLNGADLARQAGGNGLRLLDGTSMIMANTTGRGGDPRAFDTISADKVLEAIKAVEEAFATAPAVDPPMWGLDLGRVHAVKTREGAVALVEILEGADVGPLRVRYKLVDQALMPAEDSPDKAAREFMEAMRNKDMGAIMECMIPDLASPEIGKMLEEGAGELVKAYAGDLERLTEFLEWYPQEPGPTTRFVGTRIAGTPGRNPTGLGGGLYLVLSPTPDGWKVAHVDDFQPSKTLAYYVDRIVRIIPGEGPEFRKTSAGPVEAATETPAARTYHVPDVDAKPEVPAVLDLASGGLLVPQGNGENDIIAYFKQLGKGDLAWDDAKGGALITLRGAKVHVWNRHVWDILEADRKDEDLERAGCAIYQIELPKDLMVTTGEGKQFSITVKEGRDGGVIVESRSGNVAPKASEKVAPVGAAVEVDPAKFSKAQALAAVHAYAKALEMGDWKKLEEMLDIPSELDRRYYKLMATWMKHTENVVVESTIRTRWHGEDTLHVCYLVRRFPHQDKKGITPIPDYPLFTVFKKKDGRWCASLPSPVRAMYAAQEFGPEKMGRRALMQNLLYTRAGIHSIEERRVVQEFYAEAFEVLAGKPYELDQFASAAEGLRKNLRKLEDSKSMDGLGQSLFAELEESGGLQPGDFSVLVYGQAEVGDATAIELPAEEGVESFPVARIPIFTDEEVVSAGVIGGGDGSPLAIYVKLTKSGNKMMEKALGVGDGRRIAIVAGGKVVACPVVQVPRKGGAVSITGGFSVEQAKKLVAKLDASRKATEKMIEEMEEKMVLEMQKELVGKTAGQNESKAREMNMLKSYAVALMTYQLNKGSLPESLAELVEEEFLRKLELLENPATGERMAPLYHGSPGFKPDGLKSQEVVLLAGPFPSPDGSRAVAFLDSSVKRIPEEEYQKRLLRQNEPTMEGVVDSFLAECAEEGIKDNERLFALLGMKEFIERFGSGEKAHMEHHEELPPLMRFAISKETGEPAGEFVRYLQSEHMEKQSDYMNEAALLLRMLGFRP